MNHCGAVWLAGFGNEKFAIAEDARSNAGDAAALFMLGLVAIVVLMVVVFAITMARRARKPDHTLEFLDDLNGSEPTATPPAAGPNATWQKPGDWWNK